MTTNKKNKIKEGFIKFLQKQHISLCSEENCKKCAEFEKLLEECK